MPAAAATAAAAASASATTAGTVAGVDGLIFGVFRPECYKLYFEQYQFFDVRCFQFLVSKLLGYFIILGAVIVKVPQIIALMKAGRADAISPSMYILENVTYTIAAAYNIFHGNPFSTYGENIFLLLQGIILIGLVYHYNRAMNTAFFLGAAIYLFASIYLLFGFASSSFLSTLQSLVIPISIASRIPQIISNFRLGHTYPLSIITCFLNFGGSAARLFTIITELKDKLLMISLLTSVSLNGTIFLQTLYYYKSTQQFIKKAKSKKNDDDKKEEKPKEKANNYSENPQQEAESSQDGSKKSESKKKKKTAKAD